MFYYPSWAINQLAHLRPPQTATPSGLAWSIVLYSSKGAVCLVMDFHPRPLHLQFVFQSGGEAAVLSGCELHCQLADSSNDLIVPACGTTSWLEVANIIHESRVPLGLLKLPTHYSLYAHYTFIISFNSIVSHQILICGFCCLEHVWVVSKEATLVWYSWRSQW